MASNIHHIKGIVGQTISKQGHVNIPDGLFEEEHGRDGFYGPVSHLYHKNAPTNWLRIDGPLKPRAFDTSHLGVTDSDLIDSRQPLLSNADVTIHACQPNKATMERFFRNADGDDVYFIHRGDGTFETDYGTIPFTKGDYVVIPRGTTYRMIAEQPPYLLLIESATRMVQPERGLMGQHALYDPALVFTPEPSESTLKGTAGNEGDEWHVVIKRQNQLTTVVYPFNPLDIVGWKGTLTPWKLSIYDVCPVMSHRAHLAPSVHTTIQASGFVVCSFTPRPLESDPGALKVPFYHRNIDYDEMLFYHDGDFFSRDGIGPGMITFHPQGIHHGPHPKALKSSWDKTETDEYAVMVDTEKPLTMSTAAEKAEWADYYLSWRESD